MKQVCQFHPSEEILNKAALAIAVFGDPNQGTFDWLPDRELYCHFSKYSFSRL
jgi:hypothetical protein